jgi:hypothetical protein
VYRFTSGTDEATPLAANRDDSSLAPCACWKLPGPGRPPAPRPRSRPSGFGSANRSPAPTDTRSCTQVTRPMVRSTEARPRFSSSRDLPRTASSVLLESKAINPILIPVERDSARRSLGLWTAGEAPRGTDGMLRSRYNRARSGPRWRLRATSGGRRWRQRKSRTTQLANQQREPTRRPARPSARESVRSANR